METKDRQELLMRASFIKQQSDEVEQHLEFVNKQISELDEFSRGISFLIDSQEKSSLSPLGKGVYLKTSIETKKLFVEVGSGVVVRKTPEEAKKVIESQIRKFKEMQVQLSGQLEIYHHALAKSLEELEGSVK